MKRDVLRSAQKLALTLTDEQIAVIHHILGVALVVGSAGCAKTTTLVQRAIRLVLDEHVAPSKILFLTFGRKLVPEIEAKLRAELGPVGKDIEVSTFHAFGYKLIQEFHQELGLPRHLKLVKDSTKKKLSEQVARKHGITAKQFWRQIKTKTPGSKAEKVEEEFHHRYKAQKRKKGGIDFDDMITLLVKLLKTKPEIVKSRYRHLMVDEVQDLNANETKLLLLLAPLMKSAVMVGDPKQSIYGFKGASPRHWQQIVETLRPKGYALTKSFRLTRQSLKLANGVAQDIDPDSPPLCSDRDGERPKLARFATSGQQVDFLVAELMTLQDQKVDPREIAILGHTKKELSMMAVALRARGIQVNETYWHQDDTHCQIFLALLRLIRNPKAGCKTMPEDLAPLETLLKWLEIPKASRATMITHIVENGWDELKVGKKHSTYNQVRAFKYAIKKAAGCTDMEVMVQVLIDALRPVLRSRYGVQSHEFRLRDLTDLKLALRQNDLEDLKVHGRSTADRGITLMTCHAAKGKEWKYVFLINVVDGVFPSRYAKKNSTKRDEDHRVFYVAATRHSEILYVLQTPKPIRIFDKQDSGSARIHHKKLDQRCPFLKPRTFGLQLIFHSRQLPLHLQR